MNIEHIQRILNPTARNAYTAMVDIVKQDWYQKQAESDQDCQDIIYK